MRMNGMRIIDPMNPMVVRVKKFPKVDGNIQLDVVTGQVFRIGPHVGIAIVLGDHVYQVRFRSHRLHFMLEHLLTRNNPQRKATIWFNDMCAHVRPEIRWSNLIDTCSLCGCYEKCKADRQEYIDSVDQERSRLV